MCQTAVTVDQVNEYVGGAFVVISTVLGAQSVEGGQVSGRPFA